MSSETPKKRNNRPFTPEEKAAMTPEERKARGWFMPDDSRRSTGSHPRRSARDGAKLVDIARADTVEAYNYIKSVMLDEAEKTKERLWAANFIITRGHGHAQQNIAIAAQVNHHDATKQIDATLLTRDEREKLINLYNQANAEIVEAEYALIQHPAQGTDDED